MISSKIEAPSVSFLQQGPLPQSRVSSAMLRPLHLENRSFPESSCRLRRCSPPQIPQSPKPQSTAPPPCRQHTEPPEQKQDASSCPSTLSGPFPSAVLDLVDGLSSRILDPPVAVCTRNANSARLGSLPCSMALVSNPSSLGAEPLIGAAMAVANIAQRRAWDE